MFLVSGNFRNNHKDLLLEKVTTTFICVFLTHLLSIHMKYIVIVAIFLLTACVKDVRTHSTFLNTNNLKTQTFLIKIDKDTLIRTEEGLLISLPARSIVMGGKKQIKLEVKTALNLKQIIGAGLTTQTNNELLNSAGMFYIGVNENNARIEKPISVSVPAGVYDKDMQLYKGLVTDKGIEWIEPSPLINEETPIMRGEKLFKSCEQCHALNGLVIGPSLAHITKRRDLEWLYKFTLSSQDVIKSAYKSHSHSSKDEFYNTYSICHFNEYKKVVMPNQNLTVKDMGDIYAFIENESNRLQLNMPSDIIFNCTDSCMRFIKARNTLLNKRNAVISDIGNFLENKTLTTTTNTGGSPNLLASTDTDRVRPLENKSIYYKVSVNSFGWYNIDILLKSLPGVIPVDLTVRLKGAYAQNMSVYLVLPSHKVFIEGGLLQNKTSDFGFYKNNGNIPLPISKEASIFTIGEADKKLYWSLQRFTIQHQQTITMEPKQISIEEFNKAIKGISGDGLNISTSYSKNYDKIIELDSQLDSVEKLKPKNCDCDCGIIASK